MHKENGKHIDVLVEKVKFGFLSKFVTSRRCHYGDCIPSMLGCLLYVELEFTDETKLP